MWDKTLAYCMASWGIGLLAFRQGDLPRALLRLERVMGLCQDADLPLYFPWIAPALGAVYTLGGRIADAVSLLTQAIAQTTAMEMITMQALCHLSLGEVQLLAGHLEEAHALAEGALALACEHQERGHQAYALRLLGEIAARREPPESNQAGDDYRQALADELGMRPLVAHCHLGLGKLYARIGHHAAARAALTTAIELYRAMAMILRFSPLSRLQDAMAWQKRILLQSLARTQERVQELAAHLQVDLTSSWLVQYRIRRTRIWTSWSWKGSWQSYATCSRRWRISNALPYALYRLHSDPARTAGRHTFRGGEIPYGAGKKPSSRIWSSVHGHAAGKVARGRWVSSPAHCLASG